MSKVTKAGEQTDKGDMWRTQLERAEHKESDPFRKGPHEDSATSGKRHSGTEELIEFEVL